MRRFAWLLVGATLFLLVAPNVRAESQGLKNATPAAETGRAADRVEPEREGTGNQDAEGRDGGERYYLKTLKEHKASEGFSYGGVFSVRGGATGRR